MERACEVTQVAYDTTRDQRSRPLHQCHLPLHFFFFSHAHTRMHTHAHTRMPTHTRTHARTHAHTHTHTCTQRHRDTERTPWHPGTHTDSSIVTAAFIFRVWQVWLCHGIGSSSVAAGPPVARPLLLGPWGHTRAVHFAHAGCAPVLDAALQRAVLQVRPSANQRMPRHMQRHLETAPTGRTAPQGYRKASAH